MPCRPARCLSTLRQELRTQFPHRDEGSDGGCASAGHTQQNPNSHHEPNSAGVATAYDYDEDLDGAGNANGGSKMALIAQHLRQLGIGGDPRLVGGYIIYEGQIASHARGWTWRTYTGANAHKHHLHLSVARNDAAAYDSTAPWGIAALFANQGDDDMFTDADRATLDATRTATAQLVAIANRDIDTLKPLIEQVLQAVKDDPNTGTGRGDVTPEDFVAALKAAL